MHLSHIQYEIYQVWDGIRPMPNKVTNERGPSFNKNDTSTLGLLTEFIALYELSRHDNPVSTLPQS